MSILTRPNRRHSLPVQFVGSLLIILTLGTLGLIFVGHNAISLADTNAADRQERFATSNLAAEIARMPEEQRSATIWDDAILKIGEGDQDWIDANLGIWMQEYFGHHESFVLDPSDRSVFASVTGEVLSPQVYDARADVISPLVAELRATMAEASDGLYNPFEALADVAVVAPLRLETGAAIVSIVPIISETGEIVQSPGTESLHVAVRYIDAALAARIGGPIELENVTFRDAPPPSALTGIAVTDPSGEPVSWLVWEPERPGMQMLTRMLPVLVLSAVAVVLMLWWILGRLLRVSSQLKASEARLQQSQKLEAVGQLTGGIAHDFNNLLTIIMGNTEILQERLDPDHPLRPYAEMSAKAADRAAELTGRLLAFSRRQNLQPQVTDVNNVITGIEGMLRRTLSEDIDIRIVAAADLWQAELDLGQFEAALLNLAINSRDAMPGGGALTIETTNVVLDTSYIASEPGLAPGEYILIAVSDTGHGIPKGQIDHVFEPFFTTKEAGKGTGLGLSMVYGFVKQTGGHIRVYSETGHGTTVKLYFPRHYGSVPVPIIVANDSHLQRGGEKILVVEDDRLILNQLAAQLSGLGYDVLTAPAGAPALAILQDRPDITLLLTHVVLPGGMNGKQIAEAAKAIRPDLKVLYTSGYSESAILHHGRLDCGAELLSKPYRRSDLAGKVRKVLDEAALA